MENTCTMEVSCCMETFLATLAQTQGASDLLITVGRPPQLRIYNEIESLDLPDLTCQDTQQLCESILSEDQKNRFEAEKEIDMSLSISGVGRYRINIFRQRNAMALVARIVSERIPTFDQINLPETVRALADIRTGLLLFTGPTGTGKSTTVASIINHINQTRKCHIVGIEDPIEFVHPHIQSTVNQREVGSDTASFHEALRRVLRQSPDVIIIGEMRDRESAQAAITLAETGHLTIATLHTRGAIETVNRLIDMFPPEQNLQIRAQLSTSLQAVVWQQLLPRKDQEGLILACEVLRVIPAVQALIRAGRVHEICSSMQSGRKHGMCTMEQTIQDLVGKGIIEPDATGR